MTVFICDQRAEIVWLLFTRDTMCYMVTEVIVYNAGD